MEGVSREGVSREGVPPAAELAGLKTSGAARVSARSIWGEEIAAERRALLCAVVHTHMHMHMHVYAHVCTRVRLCVCAFDY